MLWIYVGLVAFVVLAIGGATQFAISSADHRHLVNATLAGTRRQEAPESRFNRLNRQFVRTRAGRLLERELVLAGVTAPPLVVLGGLLAVTVTMPFVLAQVLAPAFAVVGAASGFLLLRVWLSQARERRQEKFVQQIPELARVLSNATNAGLSIATAWAVAEQEMVEPARTEIAKLNAAVRFGSTLEEAMLQMGERLPAREVRVLMSTLVVSARSGGSLVQALRDISLTLDERKEVRREIRTTLAQARSTATLVTAMGIGMLLVLNTVQPGTVERMTQNLVGQITLVVSGGLFVLGTLLVRRMTRVER
ncbi:type II secretion system F family protein [Desertihabitans aurantiacus]|uniref:type II secretion system F family protein n=1 Tax=Desertihabitans aurantiacus TaxID=2282477 RepID=UPI000DF8525D|nr:type II secretion system F family protein [Desertihabitans aurantiacus]